MPIYPRKCLSEKCDHWFELVLTMSAYDPEGSHPCPKCESESEKAYIPSHLSASNPDPIVVFKAPDGTFRFPGDQNGVSAEQYRTLGYDRVELRGFADVRRFERTVNTQQASEMARRVERQLEAKEIGEKARRSDILNALRNGGMIPALDARGNRTGRMKSIQFTEAGKELMRQAIDRNDRKPGPRAHDTGFHSEVYNFDRSNREDSRRSDGRRNRD